LQLLLPAARSPLAASRATPSPDPVAIAIVIAVDVVLDLVVLARLQPALSPVVETLSRQDGARQSRPACTPV